MKFLITIIFFLFTYLIINNSIGENKFEKVKNIVSKDKKDLIRKYIFPYKLIDQQQRKIISQEKTISFYKNYIPNIYDEIEFKRSLKEITIKDIQKVTLENNLDMVKYFSIDGFYNGIENEFPGSGYLDIHEDNLIILSSRGVLAYKSNRDSETKVFKQIKNNIGNFININQFEYNKWFSIKDIHIHNDKIFVSFTEELAKNCWNTSVIYGEMNYSQVEFKKLFSPKNCIHPTKNIDKDFNASQSGGRITSYDNDNIFLTVGEYRSRYLAQKKDNVNGKIILINLKSQKYKIVSMGHRNPQGLYFDKEKNFIIETEHGPRGGDEINIIDLNKKMISNYGWAISSYGKHYGGKVKKNKIKYEKYPLYKSHSKYGFIEPIKSFVPSIGISEITKIDKNSYVVSSLKDGSLYFFVLNENQEISKLKRIEVFERIRDIIFDDNILYLFLEDTASIGKIIF